MKNMLMLFSRWVVVIFEVLKTVTVSIVSCDVILCSLIYHYCCFGGICCLHLQVRRVRLSWIWMHQVSSKMLVTIYQATWCRITEGSNPWVLVRLMRVSHFPCTILNTKFYLIFCSFRLSVLQVCHYFHYISRNFFWNFHFR